jgi:hypothetical protein
MEDTPEHIKKLQLEIWLAKPPGERLRLAIKSNEELHAFWNAGKKNIASSKSQAGRQDEKN